MLLESSVFTPSIEYSSLIRIQSSDVILDLGLHTLSLDPTTTFKHISGITVTPESSNVVVRNGVICGMSEYGVLLQDGVQFFDIYNVNALNSGVAGICLDGSPTGSGIKNGSIAHCIIQDSDNANTAFISGFLLRNASAIVLETCACNSNDSVTADAFGMRLEGCTIVRIASCVAGDNTTAGQISAGFSFFNCNSCSLKDCLAGKNTCLNPGPNALAAGFHIASSTDIFIEACSATSNVCTGTAAGFYFDGSSVSEMRSCQAFSNKSTAGSGFGFVGINGSNLDFVNCQSSANGGLIDGAGFALFDAAGIGMEGCEAKVNLGSTGIAYGLRLENSQLCFVKKNVFLGHQGGAGGFGVFDSQGAATTSTYLANVASKNTINFNLTSLTIPIFGGTLAQTPSPFENIAL